MTTQTVPLSSLEPSRANPRRRIDRAGIEGLATSIGSDGLLHNLVVRPVKGGGKRYRIVSGERRYRALKLLAQRGEIDSDYAVRVEIRKNLSKDDSLRLATVENLQRQNLTPLEETAALTGLVHDGTALDDIVARTGLSAATIRRRLALNALCEEARAALTNGDISLAQAEGLTLGDHETQRRVLDEIGHGCEMSGDDIRDMLLEGRPAVAMAIFPLEQYTGTITADLLADDETRYFDDVEQFFALQKSAVGQLAERFRDGSAWVDVTGGYTFPEWQYREPEEDEPAGAVINLSPSGKVEFRAGLARRAIEPATARALADAAAPAKPKPFYAAPLRRYIAHHKTVAVQEILLADARKAREVSAVALLGSLKLHEAIPALTKESEPQSAYEVLEAQTRFYAGKLGIEIEADELVWWQFPPRLPDEVVLYETVKALSDHDLDGLHTLLAALAFGQADCDRLDTGESLFNRVAQDLGVDMKNYWRPDRAFLERRNREQLLAIAGECGCAERYGVGMLRSFKKSELVACLLKHFAHARTTDEPGEVWQKGRDWLPDAMLFPAVDPDAPEDLANGEANEDKSDRCFDGGQQAMEEVV